jgi:voltage-gated potassium channel
MSGKLVERRMTRFMRTAPTVRNAVAVIVSGTVAIIVGSALVMRVFDRREFPTIGRAFWWAAQTVTTVGYGDVTPARTIGRLVAAVVMLWGIAFIAILTAAITSTFVERAAREHEGSELRAEERLEARLDELGARLERIEGLLSRGPQTPT